MSKKNHYWVPIVEFNNGKSKVTGTKRKNCADCVNELEYFLRTYAHNEVTKIGIFKCE